jgi:hypothetical protein
MAWHSLKLKRLRRLGFKLFPCLNGSSMTTQEASVSQTSESKSASTEELVFKILASISLNNDLFARVSSLFSVYLLLF